MHKAIAKRPQIAARHRPWHLDLVPAHDGQCSVEEGEDPDCRRDVDDGRSFEDDGVLVREDDVHVPVRGQEDQVKDRRLTEEVDESQTNVALHLRLEVDEVVHDRVDDEQAGDHVGDGQTGDDVAADVVV